MAIIFFGGSFLYSFTIRTGKKTEGAVEKLSRLYMVAQISRSRKTFVVQRFKGVMLLAVGRDQTKCRCVFPLMLSNVFKMLENLKKIVAQRHFIWGFPKIEVPNKPMGFFLLKMISTWGVKRGETHHLRKHPYRHQHK